VATKRSGLKKLISGEQSVTPLNDEDNHTAEHGVGNQGFFQKRNTSFKNVGNEQATKQKSHQ
jgi:hypothetical protein